MSRLYNLYRREVEVTGASVETVFHYRGWDPYDMVELYGVTGPAGFKVVTVGPQSFDHLPVWGLRRRCMICRYRLPDDVSMTS